MILLATFVPHLLFVVSAKRATHRQGGRFLLPSQVSRFPVSSSALPALLKTGLLCGLAVARLTEELGGGVDQSDTPQRSERRRVPPVMPTIISLHSWQCWMTWGMSFPCISQTMGP